MMNNDLLNQLPANEQPIASKLNSLVDDLQPSQAFQWHLETQLMDNAKITAQPVQNWFTKIMIPVGWILAAVCGVLLLNGAIRSLIPDQLIVAGTTSIPEASFESSVRNGNICAGPLALSHGFDVFLTNSEKTEFITLDAGKRIGELRSFTWSADGKRLAVLGNTTGSGNLYLTDAIGAPLRPVLSNSELGYLMGAAWSRDGKQFVMWSTQNNRRVYLLNADGTGLVEKQLDIQSLGTPRFAPDGKSITFYGADASASGLFEVRLDDSQSRMINALVEDESAFAYSPDRSRLAYVAMDRNSGGAILMVEDLETRAIVALPGSLPIPKGSGASIPEAANVSWSADSKFLVFDFGRGANTRAVYLAHADGTKLVKIADSAYAPTLSADGNCLAFISDKKVYLLDLRGISTGSVTAAPMVLADIPVGRGIADYRLDKLQWQP
jgi:Tol biopolymer transport system component